MSRMRDLAFVLVLGLAVGQSSVAAAEDAGGSKATKASVNAKGGPEQIKKAFMDQAKRQIDSMKNTLKDVTQMKAEAEKKGNVDQIQCITRAMQEITKLVAGAERAQVTLKNSTVPPVDKASAAARQIDIAFKGVTAQEQAARECSGAATTNGGNSKVDLTNGSLADLGETDDQSWEEPPPDPPVGTAFR